MSISIEDTLFELLDRVRDRRYGKYRGIVTEVEEGGRGRIKAKVPAVLGDQQATGWCDPCVPFAGDGIGFAFMPEVGSGVWIEFEGGDTSYPIWSGCYWFDGQMPSDAAPAKKVIQTKAGHKIIFDDDGESIEITDPNENSVKLDSSGITISRGGGKLLVADPKVEINDGALKVQ